MMRNPGQHSDYGRAAEFFRVLARPRLLRTVRALCAQCVPEGCRGASLIAARQRGLARKLRRSPATVARDLATLRRVGVLELRGDGPGQHCCPKFELLQRIRAVGASPRAQSQPAIAAGPGH